MIDVNLSDRPGSSQDKRVVAGPTWLIADPIHKCVEDSRMKNPVAGSIAVVGLLVSSAVFAHGGHGATPPSAIAHFLVEPVHALSAFAPLVLVAGTIFALRLHRNRRG